MLNTLAAGLALFVALAPPSMGAVEAARVAETSPSSEPVDDDVRPAPPTVSDDAGPTGRVAVAHAAEVAAFSHTVTAQFRSFAQVERQRRRLRGGLQVGAGVLLLAIGTTNFFVKRGTTAEGSGLGILGTGAVSLGGGIYGLVAKGPAETFVLSEAFRHGAREGWSAQMLQEIRMETDIKAAKARKQRRILGSLLVAGGGAGAITISTLLGLELSQPTPDGVRASSYAQGLATSVGVIVSGIVSLASPTIIEVVAHNIRRDAERRR